MLCNSNLFLIIGQKNMQRASRLFLSFVISFLYISSLSAQVNEAPFVIPALKEWKGSIGSYSLKNKTSLVVASSQDGKRLDKYLQAFLQDLRVLYPNKKFTIKTGKPKVGDVYFKLDNTITGDEAYQLNIGDHITITAAKPLGAFWATRTIIQMLEQDSVHANIPKGFARDWPQFPLRGFVLDVGRKFFTIDFLRNYVKFMSYYKMNDFQIHLNDNGFKKYFNNNWDSTYSAFRLENITYPDLTAKDGSYSKEEFVQLQKMAEGYGVNIVPEIDVPAHSLAFTKAVPEIGSSKYGKDHLDIHNPKTYEVIDNVFKEYLQGPDPVFIGEEVHIGTDEYSKTEAEKFRQFTDHYIKYVEGFGKKVRAWGALTHAKGTTPVKVKDVTLNLWYNGYAEPREMLKLGYNGISTPDGWLYIVPKAGYYYDYLNLNNIYAKWTPNMIGKEVFEENNKQIRGGSFAVWNDHVGNGISEKDVHDRVFPAMQVLAQKMWVGSKADSLVPYQDFLVKSKSIGEGPGLNIRGKLEGRDSLVLFYDFTKTPLRDVSGNMRDAKVIKGATSTVFQNKKTFGFEGTSVIETPVEGIGYGYTVCFSLYPRPGNTKNSILFSSNDASVKLNQQGTGKLGFSRDGYDYSFNYKVPENVWTHIAITGDNKGTSMYINGKLLETLEGAVQEFNDGKDKMAKVQTLFFPLRYIGNEQNGFKGYMSGLKVFNEVLSDNVIKGLYEK